MCHFLNETIMIYIPISVDESTKEKTTDYFYFRSFHEEINITYPDVVYFRKTQRVLC